MRRQNRVRLVVRRRRLEIVTIEPHRFCSVERRKVVREGKCRADVTCKLRAVVRRAQQIDRRQRHIRRHRAHVVKRVASRKGARFQQHQFVEAIEKIVFVADALAAAQRIGGRRVSAGRAAKPQIDAAGKECLQNLEALGDHSGAWFGSITPPEPTRMFLVIEAICPIMISGAELAIAGKLWCSATQYRVKPRPSANRARSSELRSACAAVEPAETGDRSRMDNGIMA